MKAISMKTKMALAISLLFVVVIALLAWGALSYQEQSLKKAISRQQLALVSSLAANIDNKLGLAHAALIAAAHQVSPDALRNADLAQRFLDDRITLRSVFDNGLFLISRSGELIAESPFLPGRRGRDLTFREFFRQTVKTGKPYISRPYISVRTPGHPAIFLSAPIFDRQGRLLAIFGGSFDLWGHNFLEDLSRTRYGDDSYFYLTDSDRTIIVHPDPSLIMTKVLPMSANSLYEKALAGFEGSGETVNAQGVRVISSLRHLRATGWILAASYPTAEAYAPLKTARRYFLLATIAFTCAVLAITWLLMKRFTAPLEDFTRHVESLPASFGRNHLLEIKSGDEIGIMAQAFNRMVMTLEAQQEKIEILNTDLASRACELEIANLELEAFNATVSHDLRMPLTRISGYCQLMREMFGGNLDEQCKKYLQEVHAATIEMDQLIDTLLRFSRLTHSSIAPEMVDLSGMAEEIIAGRMVAQPQRLAKVKVEEGVVVNGDANLLRVAMENLLGNAWKYTAKEKEALIEFGIKKIRGKSACFVRDNGVGFDMIHADRLFAAFKRLHVDEEFEGIGIGLCTVRRIIQRHGGQIWAEGKVGMGATFYFSLG